MRWPRAATVCAVAVGRRGRMSQRPAAFPAAAPPRRRMFAAAAAVFAKTRRPRRLARICVRAVAAAGAPQRRRRQRLLSAVTAAGPPCSGSAAAKPIPLGAVRARKTAGPLRTETWRPKNHVGTAHQLHNVQNFAASVHGTGPLATACCRSLARPTLGRSGRLQPHHPIRAYG